MLTFSLIGGIIGLGVLAWGLSKFEVFEKLAGYIALVIACIIGFVFFWEAITGFIIYIIGDLIEKIIEYWGISIVLTILIISFIFYRGTNK